MLAHSNGLHSHSNQFLTALSLCVFPALAGPPQLNLKMGTMPGTSPTGPTPGVDINYNKPGIAKAGSGNVAGAGGGGSPFSPIGSPSSPCTTWEESMMQLSRDLQIICRSPDRYDMPVFPPSSAAAATSGGMLTTSGSGPTSPTLTPPPTNPSPKPPSPLSTSPAASSGIGNGVGVTLRGGDAGKLLSIRHVQSEEKLREKLTYICRSPRRSRSSTSSNEGDGTGNIGPGTSGKMTHKMAAASAVAKSNKRKTSFAFPYFKTSVEIGDHTIEDLSVIIEEHKLKVFSERKDEGSAQSRGDLPVIIDLPVDVNPQKLFCVVREGILEVKESKRKCAPTNNKVLGRQLSMSYTSTGLRAAGNDLPRATGSKGTSGSSSTTRSHDHADQCPIVIEDDGSHMLKLVLRVPPGYKFNDLQIKTIDNQLLVSGRRGPQRALSASFAPPRWDKENRHDEDSFTKVFELPSSVDPFSITARLTEQHQLIIQASLSPRVRSSTL